MLVTQGKEQEQLLASTQHCKFIEKIVKRGNFAYYPYNPRMVPSNFKPKVKQVHIEIEENPIKGPTQKSRSTKKTTNTSAFLDEKEIEELKSDFSLAEYHPSPQKLSLDQFTSWHSRSSPIYKISHSLRTESFIRFFFFLFRILILKIRLNFKKIKKRLSRKMEFPSEIDEEDIEKYLDPNDVITSSVTEFRSLKRQQMERNFKRSDLSHLQKDDDFNSSKKKSISSLASLYTSPRQTKSRLIPVQCPLIESDKSDDEDLLPSSVLNQPTTTTPLQKKKANPSSNSNSNTSTSNEDLIVLSDNEESTSTLVQSKGISNKKVREFDDQDNEKCKKKDQIQEKGKEFEKVNRNEKGKEKEKEKEIEKEMESDIENSVVQESDSNQDIEKGMEKKFEDDNEDEEDEDEEEYNDEDLDELNLISQMNLPKNEILPIEESKFPETEPMEITNQESFNTETYFDNLLGSDEDEVIVPQQKTLPFTSFFDLPGVPSPPPSPSPLQKVSKPSLQLASKPLPFSKPSPLPNSTSSFKTSTKPLPTPTPISSSLPSSNSISSLKSFSKPSSMPSPKPSPIPSPKEKTNPVKSNPILSDKKNLSMKQLLQKKPIPNIPHEDEDEEDDFEHEKLSVIQPPLAFPFQPQVFFPFFLFPFFFLFVLFVFF